VLKRLLTAALVVAAMFTPAVAAGADHQDSWRWDRCRFKHLDGDAGWSIREVARTIECAVDHWPVDGGIGKAKSVAACESGMDADEYGNPPYMGVYQFHPDTWSRATSNWENFMERWSVRDAPFNGRSNVLLAIRIVHAGSWSPWSCA
jgi:hypothetical protein